MTLMLIEQGLEPGRDRYNVLSKVEKVIRQHNILFSQVQLPVGLSALLQELSDVL